MSDAKPLILSLIAIFIISGIINVVVGNVVDLPSEAPDSGVLGNLITFIDEGVTLEIPIPLFDNIELDFNIFAVFGDTLQEFMVNQLIILSVIPNTILIPLSIIILISMVYSIIKLAPTT